MVMCLGSLATENLALHSFEKALALWVRTVASVLSSISQKSCYLICSRGHDPF